MRTTRWVLAAGIINFAAASALAQITFVNYSGSVTDDRVSFQRIGVTRGGTNYAYWDDEVILPSLSRINAVANVVVATPDGPTKNADAFLRDSYLNTGLLSPGVGNGSSFGATDQWTQLTFEQPIVNSAGPDGFIASLQFLWVTPNLSPLILSTSAGHSYTFPTTGGFAGSETKALEQYIYTNKVATPADLVNFTPSPAGSLTRPTWVLQTFDLSSMGIAAGASVSSLYAQDWSGNGNGAYLSYVAGFPAIPKLGDANKDGLVDGADYTIWADHFSLTGQAWESGDFTGDSIVDGADYTLWADNFAPAALSVLTVPEPSTLGLAAIGAIALLSCRMRLRNRGTRAHGRLTLGRRFSSARCQTADCRTVGN